MGFREELRRNAAMTTRQDEYVVDAAKESMRVVNGPWRLERGAGGGLGREAAIARRLALRSPAKEW